MTQAYLNKHKITAHIVELTGSVEVMILLGVADATIRRIADLLGPLRTQIVDEPAEAATVG